MPGALLADARRRHAHALDMAEAAAGGANAVGDLLRDLLVRGVQVDVEGHERNVWDGYTASKETTRTLMKDGTTQDFHFGDDIWFVEWVPCRHGIDYNREWLEEVLETHDLQMVNYDGTLRPVGIEEALDVEFETIVFRKRN